MSGTNENNIAIVPAKVMSKTPPNLRGLSMSQRSAFFQAEARANGTYGKPTPSAAEEAEYNEKVAESLGLGKKSKLVRKGVSH